MVIDKKKNPTSIDVARLAGVSQASVSRVFKDNQNYSVKPALREKILKAANELGYIPNMVARGMISGKTNVIGLVIGEGIGPFYQAVILKIVEEVQRLGKQCLVFKMNQREKIDNIIIRVLQFQVEAIIITSPAITKSIEKICLNQNVPIILFNRLSETVQTSAVYTDAAKGGALAAQYLAENGHMNIGFIHYFLETVEESEKKYAFFATLRQHGVYNVVSEKADYDYDSGYQAGLKLLPKLEYPCAIFCTSDLIALGLIDAIKYEFQKKIPEDVSVLGYDDIIMSGWKSYHFDTIKQPIDELVDRTMSVLFNKINDTVASVEIVNVELTIVKRGSVKNLGG